MIFAVNSLNAQQISPKPSTSNTFSYSFVNNSYSKLYNNLPVSNIPSNFYCTNLGFFCKQEIKIENAVKIPLKFRLGSVQYCDWMEGKKGASILKPTN
jgi:hypothetical protein